MITKKDQFPKRVCVSQGGMKSVLRDFSLDLSHLLWCFIQVDLLLETEVGEVKCLSRALFRFMKLLLNEKNVSGEAISKWDYNSIKKRKMMHFKMVSSYLDLIRKPVNVDGVKVYRPKLC